jgi:ADP-L-glycero-D-manno-heptose 6-epimerase
MIVVTGALGFIGSNMIAKLNQEGFNDIVAVDDFSKKEKEPNLAGKKITQRVERKQFIHWLDVNQRMVQIVIHLGARTDTTEFDINLFNELNLNYTKSVWEVCTKHGLPLIYASSAATYGDGSLGYEDNHQIINSLKPLNPYGDSKNDFDKWAIAQTETPYYWVGLKFFNVYGPNEYHKGRMASVVFHAFNQINQTGGMKLFKSHNPDYKDGGQLRDFVSVVDVCDVIFYLLSHRKSENNGIYNLGTGKAETFLTLTQSVFKAMDKEESISFIDTPIDIRDTYQYNNQASMDKLKIIGYNNQFGIVKILLYKLNFNKKIRRY